MRIAIIRNVVLVLFACVTFAVNAQEEVRAEEYYAVGVSEFKVSHLEKSLEAFIKCDSLRIKDREYVGITNNTPHWKSYILYKLGREEEAYKTDMHYYQLKPVDYRDYKELLDTAEVVQQCKKNGEYDRAYSLVLYCMQKEIELNGENHWSIADDWIILAQISAKMESKKNRTLKLYQNALDIYQKYGKESQNICQNIKVWMADYCGWALNQWKNGLSYLPNIDSVKPELKPSWYLVRIKLEEGLSDTDAVIRTGKDYLASRESTKDTMYYEKIVETYIYALSFRYEMDDALKACDSLCKFKKSKYGVWNYEYIKVCKWKANIYGYLGRSYDEILVYKALFEELGDSSGLNVYDVIISKQYTDYPISEIIAILAMQYMDAMSKVDFGEDMQPFYNEMVAAFDNDEWLQREGEPCFGLLMNIYEVSRHLTADYYRRQGDIKRALAIMEQTLSVAQKVKDYLYYNEVGLYGVLLFYDKQYYRAVECLEEYLKHNEDISGYYTAYLVESYIAINPESTKIGELCKQSFEQRSEKILYSLFKMSPDERFINWNNEHKVRMDEYVAMANSCNGKNSTLNIIAYNSIILGKSFILTSQAGMMEALNNSDDSTVIALKEKIVHMYDSLQRNITTEGFIGLIDAQSQLSSSLESTHNLSSLFGLKMEDVCRNLSQNSIAVEFVYAKSSLVKDGYSYYAYVVRKDWDSPVIIKLDIDENVFKSSDIYINKKFTARIWREIIKKANVKVGDTIYFATDKILHNVSVENMRWGKGGEPISTFYNMHRLTSTRELALQKREDKPTSIVLYGGLDYAGDGDSISNGADTLYRGSVSGLTPLPGTKQEVDEIVKVIEESPLTCKITCYTGNDGTEESFARLSGSAPSVLHIATHGDYAESQDSAMFKSVLYFAGSEEAYFRGYDVSCENDGIVTADEILNMDLSDVDLAVLSACSSAVGGISPDGVVGLQRGFKNAGVKSLIMTLWPVDDRAAKVLMVEFYRNWIEKGMSKHGALEAAKRTVRETKGWSDPEYWAGFILLD